MATPAASPEPLLRPAVAPWQAAESPRRNRLAVLLGRATRHRQPSMLVRETAALQLEERRAHWGYSRPVVALDVAWNLSFAVAAAAVLASTLGERPNAPIRLWVAGYALQCVLHAAFVWVEYRRRNWRWRGGVEDGGRAAASDSEENDSEEEEEEEEVRGDLEAGGRNRRSRITKRCESVNTVASFIWWTVGFYWVVSGGETLLQNAPKLYWLAVVFLAFDVFFAILCVALACLIGIALCCCLPCIIAILYAVAGQEGASDADISILPRYKFVQSSTNEDKESVEAGTMIPLGSNSGDPTHEQLLLLEDAECCICLTTYEDGVELHALPCNHHFHTTCITKWLRINATCPLCKYNILKGNE